MSFILLSVHRVASLTPQQHPIFPISHLRILI